MEVTTSTILNLFLRAFPQRTGQTKSNVVPEAKFSDYNAKLYADFCANMAHVNPWRVIFGDEKPVCGEDVFTLMSCCCPFSGVNDAVVAPKNF